MNYIERVVQLVHDGIEPENRPTRNADELYHLYALLVLVKGEETSSNDVHDAWTVWCLNFNKDHPALIPFSHLSENEQMKDDYYRDVIRQVASVLLVTDTY